MCIGKGGGGGGSMCWLTIEGVKLSSDTELD